MSAVSILVRDDGINPLPDLFNPAIHHDEFSRALSSERATSNSNRKECV